MKALFTFICTTIAFCCLSPEAGALPKQEKKAAAAGNMWVLQQTHTDVGPEDVYIAPDGVKVVNRRSGYELLCKAPKWAVHCYRHSARLEWTAPLSFFDGMLLINPHAEPRLNTLVFLPKAKGNTLGLSYRHFVPDTGSLSFIDGTADIPAAPSALEFLCRLNRCPNTHTVPLLIKTDHGKRTLPKFKMGDINTGMGNDLRSGLIEELTTQSCKKIPYDAEIFAPPLRFKRTMSLLQVTFSTAMKSQFDEIFRDGTGFRGELH